MRAKSSPRLAARRAAVAPTPSWTFLSNHGHVLLCIATQPELTLRDVAAKVGITERAVQRIVAELEEAGVLEREREGRRNVYRINGARPLRHALESHRRVQDLIDLVRG
ncbi:MAG: winged helix-turn-helix domain-containing protein [Vicinamibacteria bacterium]|nr:winged helix-turn-helix domain-containing protein [Vicinamibacteria bacterium]